MRRHLTEQVGLIAQHRDVGDRVTAIGEHHRHIDQHLTTVMATATLLGRCHRRRQRRRQPDLIGEIGQQSRTGMVHDPGAATGELDARPATITLHHGSALLVGGLGSRQTRVSRTRRAFSRTRPPHRRAATEQGGLSGPSLNYTRVS